MRKWLFYVCVLALSLGVYTSAQAQDYPSWEFEGHYSYVRFNASGHTTTGTFVSASKAINLNGGGGSVAYNPAKWFGLVADFGGYHNGNITDSRLPGDSADATIISYMFGPRLTYRTGSAWTPFAQALFGATHASASVTVSGTKSPTKSENDFAFAIGGGLDAKIASHIAIRLVQAEYFRTKINGGSAATNSGIKVNDQNNLRLSFGIVFQLGGK